MNPTDLVRPFPADDYHPHHPDAEGDLMVLLMAIAASILARPDASPLQTESEVTHAT